MRKYEKIERKQAQEIVQSQEQDKTVKEKEIQQAQEQKIPKRSSKLGAKLNL